MQTKLTKSIQMILRTVFVIVIGAIIVGLLSSNNVIAYSHNLKAADFIKTEFYMSHTTYYVCTECDYKTEKTEECKLINFKKIDEEKHEAQCKECQDKYALPHVDDDNNGICDDCLYKMTNSTTNDGKHVCLENSEEKIVIFDKNYHDYYAVCTLCENPVPDWQKREEHSYQNGKCKCGQEEVVEIKVTSKKYELDNAYISKVQPKATVSEFKDNIETNGTYVNIYNKNNQLVSNGTQIGTGMKTEIKIGDTTKNFTIIVNGDVNGDGKVDFKDMVKINQVRLDKTSFDEMYSLAADVTGDNKVDFKDLVKINRFRLNKVTEL